MKRKSAAMQIRSFEYDIKAVSDDGLFSGYGSVFGVVDSYNEVVAPGAFIESLADTRAKGRTLPVLWHHRGSEPIGDWDINQLKEDTHDGVPGPEDSRNHRPVHRLLRTR
ncbi:hypothetical protein G6F59_017204 [Rhizopus arrhizus]|nr:hypothetical protein G6F59_017204 [Rhizopus arrhizus]